VESRESRRKFIWYVAGGFASLSTYAPSIWEQVSSPLASNLAEGIQALKPGQYLWAPMVAPYGPVLAVISLTSQRVYVYRNGVLIGAATVSTGKPGHQTPTGVFTVLQKQVHHKSNLYDSAPMPYMQRLTWSGVAMHAGNLSCATRLSMYTTSAMSPHVDAGRGVAAVLLKQILSDFLLGCLGVVGDERFGRDGNIAVPEARPLRLQESPYTTFLVKRFDRTRHGRRLAFVSAMTLTQHKDGEPGASYLELVDLLQSRGADTAVDCEQLFRRVLFNVLIHNTDDHLRNHGFFIGEQGIRLSPAYDMNPSIDREALTLAINEVETACDVAIAMDAYRDYGLTTQQADRALQRVQTAIHSWRSEASRLHIPHAEQDLMAAAFEP